jgi:hypothetical protein
MPTAAAPSRCFEWASMIALNEQSDQDLAKLDEVPLHSLQTDSPFRCGTARLLHALRPQESSGIQ